MGHILQIHGTSAMTQIRPLPVAGQRWLHRKGDVYTVVHVTSEPEDHKAHEFPVTVIYRGPDGRTWPRTLESFLKSFTLIAENR